jgi:hypothetical protein
MTRHDASITMVIDTEGGNGSMLLTTSSAALTSAQSRGGLLSH